MITVHLPLGKEKEKAYIVKLIVGDRLGLPVQYKLNDRSNILISIENSESELILPDTFFSKSKMQWLSLDSFPKIPLKKWDTRNYSEKIRLCNPIIPVIYGSSNLEFVKKKDLIELPIDIFGSAFFMFTGYGEIIKPSKDFHKRSVAKNSLPRSQGFLERPIIDEYIEILWFSIKYLWPNIKRKKINPKISITCDLDNPFYYKSFFDILTLKRFSKDFFKNYSPSQFFGNIMKNYLFNRGHLSFDPFYKAIEFIMDQNERLNQKVIFYFIPFKTNSNYDLPLALDDSKMRLLIKKIYSRGHIIGVHPGYETFNNLKSFNKSIELFKKITSEEGVSYHEIYSRQHYLRWDYYTTPQLIDSSRLSYDSSLYYAESIGFRNGTCHDFLLFDIKNRRELTLVEKPLIVMEDTLFSPLYLNLDYDENALASILKLKNICFKYSGTFTLLWHNSSLISKKQKHFYSKMINQLYES